MKLTDRDPKFSECYGVRCYLSFRCPCKPECEATIAVPFAPSLDGQELHPDVKQKAWQRTGGDDFDTLTLEPSLLLHPSSYDGHAGWHGFLRNGQLETC